MKNITRTVRFIASSLLLVMLAATPLLAKPAPAPAPTPAPPKFILDKQLPGEDAYWIYRPTFSPDAKLVAAFMSSTKTINMWDTATGKVVYTIQDSVHGMDALDGMIFTNDGKQLMLLRSDKPMKWLDYAAGKITREIALNADPKKILDYAFNASQTRLAVATYTGIKLWDVTAGKQLAEYEKGKVICAVDMTEYTTQKPPKRVRLLAWARALMPPDQKFKGVAGIIDLDTGKNTTILDDVPADKKVDDHMTFFRVKFDGSSHWLLVGCYVIPPTVKASLFLVNTWDGKYIDNTQLGQLIIEYEFGWLGKPFWGYLIGTADLRDQSVTHTAVQFLLPTKTSLKIIDTMDENELAVQSFSIAPGNQWAAVTVKKSATDTSKLYLYKLVPKPQPWKP